MRSRTISTILACALSIGATLSPPSTARAAWVDDWLTQKTETSPSYFEGEKRGYYTGGSFSARWPQNTDYPFTVTLPKIKAGCGGIDAFMGGFSFMNFEYLVQKLQRIMQATPAVAFDIALKTLSAQLSESITKFESITDALNAIQLDDCKASKGLVATLASPFAPNGSQLAGDLAAMRSDFMQSSGIENLWSKVQAATKANNDNPPDNNMANAMAGCPQDVKDVFGDSGSVLEKLSAKFGNSAYADMIRGYLGDVMITKSSEGIYAVKYEPPCENKSLNVDSFLDGNVLAKHVTGACYQITDSNRDLRTWTINKMTSIANKLKAKGGTLSSEDIAFLDANPLPVALVLRYAVGTNQESAVIGTLADVTARAYAFSMLSDFYYRAQSIFEKAQSLATAQQNAKQDQAQHTCKVEMLSSAPQMIVQMNSKTHDLLMGVRASYASFANEVNAIMALVERLERFNNIAGKSLTGKFSKSLADRAIGKD